MVMDWRTLFRIPHDEELATLRQHVMAVSPSPRTYQVTAAINTINEQSSVRSAGIGRSELCPLAELGLILVEKTL